MIRREENTMIEFLGIVILIILIAPFLIEGKYKGIERQQAMRRAMIKLQEKYRQDSL